MKKHFIFCKKIFIYFLILLFFSSLLLYAQNKYVRFKHISIEEGLAQSDVICILQDSRGFMWFGTEDGLNRYNGYEFDVFKLNSQDPTTLSNNYIYSIYEDKAGILWIGTRFGGVNKLDPKTEKFVHYMNNQDSSNSLSNNQVNVIFEDSSGKLWFGTENGLNKFQRENERFTRFFHNPDDPHSLSHNNILSICEDREGMLWIGTEEGLNSFDQKKGKFKRYLSDSNDPYSLSDNTINSIYEDSKGVLWIGTEKGLNKYDQGRDRFINFFHSPDNPDSLSHNHISYIYEDSKGVLWVGTFGGGINIFQSGRNGETSPVFIKYRSDIYDSNSLSNDRVLSIYEDRSQVLWIGTDIGLNIIDQRRKEFILYQNIPNNKNSLSNNFVRPIYKDRQGIFWFGTYGSGLDKYDRKKGKFTHYKHDPENSKSLSNNLIRAIYEDKSGELWIGTEEGLNKFDREKELFTRYVHDPDDPDSLSNNLVYSIIEDKFGVFWVGTQGGGIDKFDRKRGIFSHYKNDSDDPHSLSDDMVYVLYEDHQGTLWIGTLGGLNKFDRQKEQFVCYQNDPDNSESLSHDYIVSICEDSFGNLWVGTLGGGLNKFDREREVFKSYDENNGIPNNSIYGILEDDQGNLWFSHNKGITRFNIKSEEIKNYDVSDGLGSNEFNGGSYFKTDEGEILFGSINGVTAFFPDEIKDNFYIPPVVISEFQIFNKTIPIGGGRGKRTILTKSITETKNITLSYRDRVFSFEFAALHYASPDKNKYAYFMEGFDEDWHYVGNRRFASYTNLSPGEYVFRVKGSNSDGVWNEKGTFINIKITPPIWKTNWFQGLVLLMIVFLVIAIIQVRTQSMRKRSRELEEKVQERTHELKNTNEELEKEIDERKKLEKRARHMATQATLINDVGQRVSSQLEINALLLETVNAIRDAFNFYSVSILIVDQKTNNLVLRAIAGGDIQLMPMPIGSQIQIGEGMTGYAAKSGKTQLSGDVRENRYYVKLGKEKTKSELAVPIKIGKEVIGVLDIQSDKLNNFSESDVKAMETLSAQVTTAIENARLYDKAQIEIQERKKTEKALRKSEKALRSSEEKYRSLTNQLPVGVYRTTKEGKYLFANRALANILEYEDVQELMKTSALDAYVNPLQRKKQHESWKKSKGITSEVVQFRTKKGKKIWVRDTGHTILNKKKEIDYIDGIVEDITEQKKAEEELEKRQRYLESVFSSAPDAIITLDNSHKVVEWNEGAERIFGYKRKEVLGKDIDDIVTGPVVKNEAEKFTKLTMSGKKVPPVESVRYRKDKKPVNVIVAGSPIVIGKKLIGVVAVYTDITSLKKTEERLKKALEDLEDTNAELKDFAYIVSHDLKAPLRAVSQLVTWISEDYSEKFDSEGKQKMDLLRGRVKRMSNLIDGVLKYSRAGTRREEKVEVDCQQLVNEVIETISPPENIKVLIPKKLPKVIAEQVKLQQVFQNLISNGVKYMDKTEGKIIVDCQEENNYWRFSISDNGPGIEKKYQDDIFKIFHTLESRDKRESTGVGLSLVKKIVEHHGGKIWLDSKLGKGSTFYFTLEKKNNN
ncbi:MAG: two-component regulator propeller domain-containing protein [Candidatus Aminicenantaceae bacterium]